MKVRVKTLMSSPEGVFQPGSILSCDDRKGEMLIAGGFAELVEATPVPAVEPVVEETKSEELPVVELGGVENAEAPLAAKTRKARER